MKKINQKSIQIIVSELNKVNSFCYTSQGKIYNIKSDALPTIQPLINLISILYKDKVKIINRNNTINIDFCKSRK